VEHRLNDLEMPRPAAANNLYVEVAHALRALIVERKMKPGDRLPSERVLAQQLQVGRPVVRDALRILETLGLIGVSPRQGSYVQEPDMAACMGAVVDSVARSLSAETGWQEGLWEARRILEAEAAALAAQRATPEDLRALEEALDRLRQGLDDATAFQAAEGEFARALAQAARNPILAGMARGLAGLCQNGAAPAHDAAVRLQALQHYQAAVAAIAAGRAGEAREATGRQLQRNGNRQAPAA
jgi:GntR family transcriptional repressor for pyruvate dehydrogenase complex